MRKLLWLLLPLPLLLLLVYTALPYVARTLIEDWLAGQGFDSSNIQLTHPGWNKLEIPYLSLTQSGNERQITLEARDASILFDAPSLLLKGRIDEIRIPRLQMKVTANRSIEARLESSGEETFDLNSVPPSLLFHYAPSRRLVIGEAVIDYRAPEQPVLQARGNIDLTRQQLISRMRLEIESGEGSALDPVYLDLVLDVDQHYKLALLRDNHAMASVEGELKTSDTYWQTDLAGALKPAALHRWLEPLAPGFPIRLNDGHADTTFRIEWPALLPLESDRLLHTITAEARSTLKLQSAPLSMEDMGASGIELTLDIEAELTAGKLLTHIHSGSRLTGTELRSASWSIRRLELALLQPVEIDQTLYGDMARTIGAINLQALPEGVQLEGLDAISLSPITAKLNPVEEPLALEFSLAGSQVDIGLSGKQLPSAAFDTQGRWNPDGATGNLQLGSRQPKIDLSARWRLNETEFRADWMLQPLGLTALQPTMQRWIDAWPDPLSLGQGELKISGSVTGPTPTDVELNADIDLRNAQLLWGEQAEIDSLDGDLSLTYTRNATLRSRGALHSRMIRTGIDITDTRLDYSFTRPKSGSSNLTLQPLTLNLLGGHIALPEIGFDPSLPRFETTATLQGIQLGEALRLYRQPGLAGETALSGSLPISVEGKEIRIKAGHIGSDAPGWIRYEPSAELEAAAQSNPGLQLALSALSNLQLNQLELQVDYAPNGDLELNSRLRGQNPDWQQGRPIDLTLNIEENLLQLLRSLQMSQRIGESLERQLKR